MEVSNETSDTTDHIFYVIDIAISIIHVYTHLFYCSVSMVGSIVKANCVHITSTLQY